MPDGALTTFMLCARRALCSRAENFESLRRENDGSAVEIGNPATAEFEVGTAICPHALALERGVVLCLSAASFANSWHPDAP